jgi:hypothetical protein
MKQYLAIIAVMAIAVVWFFLAIRFNSAIPP